MKGGNKKVVIKKSCSLYSSISICFLRALLVPIVHFANMDSRFSVPQLEVMLFSIGFSIDVIFKTGYRAFDSC